MSNRINGDIKKRIVSVLRQNPEGLTMLKIARLVGVHRNTIPRYLYELKGEEKVLIRKIGPAKLFYLNRSFIRRVNEKDVLEKLRSAM